MKPLHALIKTHSVKSCVFVSCVFFSILRESSFFSSWIEQEKTKQRKTPEDAEYLRSLVTREQKWVGDGLFGVFCLVVFLPDY